MDYYEWKINYTWPYNYVEKKPKPSNYVRYLGIYLDEYLNWSAQLVPPY